jgi:hypothetical protein
MVYGPRTNGAFGRVIEKDRINATKNRGKQIRKRAENRNFGSGRNF